MWCGQLGVVDELQYVLMGLIMFVMFDMMEILWEMFLIDFEQVGLVFDCVIVYMDVMGCLYVFVMQKGSVVLYELKVNLVVKLCVYVVV